MKKIISIILVMLIFIGIEPVFAYEESSSTSTYEESLKDDYIELLHEYAPLIWYSSFEDIWPSSIEEMYKCGYVRGNRVIYTKSLKKLKGNLSTATNYAFFFQDDENTMRLVYEQYYMFDPGKLMILSHYGDWEGCIIEFNKVNGEWVPVTFSFNHHGITTEVDWNSSELNKTNNHPIIYAARGSHGIYLSEGIQQYRTCLFDSTNQGTSWSTWDSLECYYYDSNTTQELISLEGNDHTYEFLNIVYWGQSPNSPTGPITEE